MIRPDSIQRRPPPILAGAWTATLLILALTAPVARATADGPDFLAVTGIAPGGHLRIREAPSPHARRMGALPHDARHLANLGCTGLPTLAEWQAMNPGQRQASRQRYWCRVRTGEMVGWVAGRYLREDGSPPATTDR